MDRPPSNNAKAKILLLANGISRIGNLNTVVTRRTASTKTQTTGNHAMNHRVWHRPRKSVPETDAFVAISAAITVTTTTIDNNNKNIVNQSTTTSAGAQAQKMIALRDVVPFTAMKSRDRVVVMAARTPMRRHASAPPERRAVHAHVTNSREQSAPAKSCGAPTHRLAEDAIAADTKAGAATEAGLCPTNAARRWWP